MNKLILPFLNPKDFVANDKPRVFPKALTTLHSMLTGIQLDIALTTHGILDVTC